MKTTTKLAIFKNKSLNPDLKRAIKSTLKPKGVMSIQSCEVEDFFHGKECQAYAIRYNDAAFRDVKSIIKIKTRKKSKVLAILKGNQRTTLDHLNSIWTSILNNVSDVSWGYYLSSKPNNTLFLFVK